MQDGEAISPHVLGFFSFLRYFLDNLFISCSDSMYNANKNFDVKGAFIIVDMDKYKAGIRKRRQERLHLLRKKRRETLAISDKTRGKGQDEDWFGYTSAMNDPEERQDHQGFVPLYIKIIGSVLLVVVTVFVMQLERTEFAAAQRFISHALEHNMNVQGVMSWYEGQTGNKLEFLPSFLKQNQSPNQVEKSEYIVPVTGATLMSSYNPTQQAIALGTNENQEIEVIQEGWVTFVGERDGFGTTVIINHGQGLESWYGRITNPVVQVNDWVEQGNVIGYSTRYETDGKGIFYFAIRQDAMFIDPMEVIKFE